MKVFGIAGHSGMGKTSLLERLVPELASRGLRVSLIKHSDKAIDIDRPGKDSHRLRAAGGNEVLVLGKDRWALMHELRGAPEPSVRDLLGRLQPCDLVLIEGFKQGNFPKLEVWRPSLQRSTLWPTWPNIVGIASDASESAIDTSGVENPPQQFDLDNVKAIADFAMRQARPVEEFD